MNQKLQFMKFTLANDHIIVWPSNVTLTFNLPERLFKIAHLLLKKNCAKLFWNSCVNVEVMALTRSIYDHFIIWSSSMNLTFNLPEQMFQINNCAILFWNPYITVEVMAQTSSIYDHFIIWPSSVTLIFNLPEQMFQMAHLCLKKNNCAKLFWNPCINVEVMAWTRSLYDHFIICPSSVTLIFNLPELMFKMALLLLKENNCAKLFWNPRINVEVMAQTSSVYDHFNIWPSSVTSTFNLPVQMFQMALLHGEQLCQIILISRVWTNPDGRTLACTTHHNAHYTELKL